MYLNYLGESFPHSRNAVALNLSISDAQSFANKSYPLGTPFHRNLPPSAFTFFNQPHPALPINLTCSHW